MAHSPAAHLERLALGGSAIFTLQEAAALLPIAAPDALKWLKEQGLVRQLEGCAIVTWRSVLDAVDRLEVDGAQRAPLASLKSSPPPKLTMRALAVLKVLDAGENYCVNIHKAMANSEDNLHIRTVYALLYRMELNGLIRSRKAKLSSGSDNRLRRFYGRTSVGMAALEANKTEETA